MEERQLMRIPLIKKIDHITRKTGFDNNFVLAASFHFGVDNNVINIKTRKQAFKYLISKIFIDKLDMYPTDRFICNLDETSGWPVPLLPSETFGETKVSDVYRRDIFYACLKISDILECRVASVVKPNYELRVIHKYGTTRILDDLNLVVVMPHCKNDLKILKTDLLPSELIRVAVYKIDKEEDNITVYVSVDPKYAELRILPTMLDPSENSSTDPCIMGRISGVHLPSYVLDPPDNEMFPSYSYYLKNVPQFRNPTLLNGIYAGFGIDPAMMYSFYPNYNRYKCSDDCTGQTLLERSKLNDAKKFTAKGLDEFDSQMFPEALQSMDKALELCPKNHLYRAEIYEIRGKIHKANEKPKGSINAINDWVKAFSLNPKNEVVRRLLSKEIFKRANKFYRSNEYRTAATLVEDSLKLFKNNTEASSLRDYLKKNHQEAFLDEESLVTLHEKKKEIVTELKKMNKKANKKVKLVDY